jgi:hypothetical protein
MNPSAALPHELGAEYPLGLVPIVRAAAQADPLDRRLSATSHGFDMIELQESPPAAAVPALAHEPPERPPWATLWTTHPRLR